MNDVDVAQTADAVRWDLSRLAADAADARSGLDEIRRLARALERTYRGRIPTLDDAGMAVMLDEYAHLSDVWGRLRAYSELRLATDAQDEEARDLADATSMASLDADNSSRFLELELGRLDDARREAVVASPLLTRYRQFLAELFARATHLLPENEERVLAAREPTAVEAWQELHDRTLADLSISYDAGHGERDHTLDEMLGLLNVADTSARHGAFTAIHAKLATIADTQAACYDAVVRDRLTVDGLRGYDSPMAQANEANVLSDSVVDQLILSVERHYPLAQRWFGSKAHHLGRSPLSVEDQYAPLGTPFAVTFGHSRQLIHEALDGFSADACRIVDDAFEEHRIDAEPRRGKSGGAFCTTAGVSRPPYLLLTYSGMADDLETLAHELGHLLHFTLAAANQTSLTFSTGMALAEIPSTFNELLLYDLLMARSSDPGQQLFLSAARVESGFKTIFRQVVLADVERRAYALKAQQRALTPERLSTIWMEENGRYYGDAVRLPEAYRVGWTYISHFVATRFYTYSYAFAHLASLALYARFRQDRTRFPQQYLEFLALGGAQPPAAALATLGVDISDPAWVNEGFMELERIMDTADALMAAGA